MSMGVNRKVLSKAALQWKKQSPCLTPLPTFLCTLKHACTHVCVYGLGTGDWILHIFVKIFQMLFGYSYHIFNVDMTGYSFWQVPQVSLKDCLSWETSWGTKHSSGTLRDKLSLKFLFQSIWLLPGLFNVASYLAHLRQSSGLST